MQKLLRFFFFFLILALHVHGLNPLQDPVDETAILSISYLGDVSRSVLKAEAWLRANVLFPFPASGTTAIVIGDAVSCTGEQDEDPQLGLVLPSLMNIHRSLTRWGLERDIKVSVSLSKNCFASVFHAGTVRSLLKFLETVNSTHILTSSSVKPPPLPAETTKFASLMPSRPFEGKSISRKLYSDASSSQLELVKPNPARPSPSPEISPDTPLHSSVGYPIPAHIAKSPLLAPPSSARPPLAFPFAPVIAPAMPPLGLTLPPCASAPSPTAGGMPVIRRQRQWCVAKPTVPEETLQEAMDYACGKGGGDCREITPSGSCYYPNTVIGHASYAFNSYWQKNKRNGGSCGFGGTAMLINADPSYLRCRFELD